MALQTLAGTPAHEIPAKRQDDFRRWQAALAHQYPSAEDAIRRELNAFCDGRIRRYGETPGAGFCSSWMPGANWEEGSGVYQPIFETMVVLYVDHRSAHQRAGWFFGLLLMDVIIHRDDDNWEFWREPTDPGDDPQGLYYRPVLA